MSWAPGVIRSREHVAQIRSFHGLRWGSISPTDIDAFIDFGNRLFVFIETKYGNVDWSYGQRLALERLCDACATATRTSIAFFCRHTTPSHQDIDFGRLTVSQYRIDGNWHTPPEPLLLTVAIDSYRARFL